MTKPRVRHLTAMALAGAISGYAGGAGAAGFAIIEHSAQGMGNAFAGGGAVAEDASAVWFNPASITRLPSQMMAAGHLISPSFEFTDSGSTQAGVGPLLPGAPATADGGQDAFVPNFYYIRTFTQRLSFGLAVNAPFGLATEYDRNWKGRYHAVESEIININVNPVIAWKANDVFSVGAGVSVNYIDAKLSNAVDFGTICVPFANCGGTTAGPGTADGFVENEADDISYGYNFGLFYEPSDRTRFSLAYRSQINHKLEGEADFSNVPALLSGAFFDDGIKAGVSLPDQLSFSVYHRVLPKVGLMADATWTGWSDIPELRIIFDSSANAGGTGTSTESLSWEDTWRFGLGASYYASDRLTLRTGVAYDEAPVPNPTERTPRLPDNDRIWVSIGAGYHVTDRLSADVGYTHLFIDDTNIARTNSTGATLNGTYESDADIFSLQVSYLFD